MSLKKQTLRQYTGNSRAFKTALLSSSSAKEKGAIATSPSLLPSIEESLRDWLSQSLPSSSPLSDVCLCCKRDGCQHFEAMSSTIHRLEKDVHLAAVIGQGLLQNHERNVTDTDLLRAEFKQEREALEERISQLEYSLSESDYLKTEFDKEKDRLAWELQRAQKSLEDTTVDLENCNSRYLQLSTEFKSNAIEIERLRACETMAVESDVAAEVLRTKVEDLEQQLAASKKAESLLESKCKKIESKYNLMSATLEKLKTTQKEMGITEEYQVDMMWLRESNEKLRKDVLKLTYALLSPNAAADLQMTNSNQNYLIELIKELASANNKLKSDLLDCSSLLIECKSDLCAKSNPDEEQESDDESKDARRRRTLFSHLQDASCMDILTPMPVSNTNKIFSEDSQNKQDETASQDRMTPLPENQNVSPVIHHHYHYYIKKKMMSEKRKPKRKRSSVIETEEGTISITPSSSCSSAKIMPDLSSPFHQLYKQAASVLQRLQQSDIRALNRRMRRTFDIVELSNMSNTIIENIATDVHALKSRFSWVGDELAVKKEQWAHDVSIFEFFPIAELVQSMLTEIGQLRNTMNDLQLEYVKKIEEINSRFEKELLAKQVLQQPLQKNIKTEVKSAHPIHWLSSIFNRKCPKPNSTHSTQDERRDSALHGTFYTHFLKANSNSSISIYSNPIHPYSKPTIIS